METFFFILKGIAFVAAIAAVTFVIGIIVELFSMLVFLPGWLLALMYASVGFTVISIIYRLFFA